MIKRNEIKLIINSSTINELKRNLKIQQNQDIFEVLLGYMNDILSDFNIKYKSVVYRILGFLEKLSTEENTNLMTKLSVITGEKDSAISMIKEVDKQTRKNSKEVIILRDLANRLENLEINIKYNIKSPDIIANYNIVKHILFDIKNIEFSKRLITKNAHLINAYSIDKENIFDTVVKEYLKSIENHAKSNKSKDLLYYEEVLNALLQETKIKKDLFESEKYIQKIIAYDKCNYETGKQKRKAIYWYKHLIKKLDNPDYEESIENLNNMYDVKHYFDPEIIREGHIIGYKKDLYVPNKNDYIISMDPESTYDRDDAFSVKKIENGVYHLKIYIADPNTFCGTNSKLIKEAKERRETLYLENKIIGMFPKEIVTDYLSLDENMPRLAREYNFIITKEGTIENFYIVKKPIITSKNFSYEKANKEIKHPSNFELERTFQDIIDVTNIINRNYEYLKDDKNNYISGEKIVETIKVFLGITIGEYASKNNYSMIYRHYMQNKEISGINLDFLPEENKSYYLKVIKEIEKANMQATYSLNNKYHEIFKMPYCQIGAPLRRASDILGNECIDKFYFERIGDKDIPKFEEYLKEEIDKLNDKSLRTTQYVEKYSKAISRIRK